MILGRVVVIALIAACSRGSDRGENRHVDDAAIVRTSDDARRRTCGNDLSSQEIAPGLRVERIRSWIEPPLPLGDRCLLILRIDPARYELRLLTEREHGKRRPAPRWAADFGLVAATNASMFHDDGRSTGLMVDGDRINNGAVNVQFGAFLAFEPVAADAPPVVMLGSSCDGFDLDRLRSAYRVIVQNYRLLDCDGSALEWKDQKIYSAAAIAIDQDGHVAFILSRTPYRPKAFARMLASPRFRLRAAMYVEGGPEASVYARAGGVEIDEVGSYETQFLEDDGNSRAWPIPNVIGAAPR